MQKNMVGNAENHELKRLKNKVQFKRRGATSSEAKKKETRI